MEPKRIGKQFIYGVAHLTVLGLVLYGGYALFIKTAPTCTDGRQNQSELGVDCGGPCGPCTEGLEAPAVVVARVFTTAETPVLLITLRNPHTQFGVSLLPYTLSLMDTEGAALDTIPGTTYLHPGEREKQIVILLGGNRLARSARVELGVPVWRTASEFRRPDVSFVQNNAALQDGRVVVTGEVRNNETLALDNISVVALFYDTDGRLVGASKTAVQTVVSFERRAFAIEYPATNLDIDVNKTRLFYEARLP